jgi:ADP-ribosylation factor related protein 1
MFAGNILVARITVKDKRLILWDLGGQRSLRSIWKKYYSDATALIFIVDSTAPEKFAEAKECFGIVLN